MKTYSAKPSDIQKKWVVIDADGVVLGRLASVISMRLRGKHLTTYTPHMDCGDNVIVINAEKVHLTGRKLEDKVFHWHTGFRAASRAAPWASCWAAASRAGHRQGRRAHDHPRSAGPRQMKNLRVYAGADHPHAAQQPEVLDVGSHESEEQEERLTHGRRFQRLG